jgi:hypothetical protein
VGPCPKNADAVLANAKKHTAAVVDVLAHERMACFFLTSWATEQFRRIILTNAGVIVVEPGARMPLLQVTKTKRCEMRHA